MNIFDVKLSVKAMKDLKNLPAHVVHKLQAWIEMVGDEGLGEVRKIAGYHDEPLKGKRKGQRSIRLNIAYRAIYIINEDNVLQFVEIMEINKHDY